MRLYYLHINLDQYYRTILLLVYKTINFQWKIDFPIKQIYY